MSRPLLASLLLVVLTGCVSPKDRSAEAEQRAYERGYRQAVKEQYQIIQRQQRHPSSP